MGTNGKGGKRGVPIQGDCRKGGLIASHIGTKERQTVLWKEAYGIEEKIVWKKGRNHMGKG